MKLNKLTSPVRRNRAIHENTSEEREVEQKFISQLYRPLKKYDLSPLIGTGIDIGNEGVENLLEISTFGILKGVSDLAQYEKEMLSDLRPYYEKFGDSIGYELVLFKIGKGRFSKESPHIKADRTGVVSFYLYAAFMRKMEEYQPAGKLYHVTWLESAQEILRNGMNASLSDMNKNYFFTDLKSARGHVEIMGIHPMYEKSRKSGIVAILEIDLDKIRGMKFNRDPEDTVDLTSIMTRSNIPPEAISLVEKHKLGDY